MKECSLFYGGAFIKFVVHMAGGEVKIISEYFTEDGQQLHFTTDNCEFEFDGVLVRFEKMPYLKNEKTNESYLPTYSEMVVERIVKYVKREGLSEFNPITPPNDLITKEFFYCEGFPFEYSALEYYFIPGLIREQNDGFLTPVYFNLEVLNKYTQHPDYDLKLMSSTYGSLCYKEDWSISFGVNRNNKVIMWLGDIDGLPDKEKYYLLSENTPPEFEIHSEFYNAQICVQWSEGAIENKVFENREQLSCLMQKKYGLKLFKLEGEISKVINDLQKPVFWENKHVAPVIESLNRIFVESLCEDNIRKIIIENHPGSEVKGMKGLKLFSKLLSDTLQIDNADALMCPFFVLYDYRVVMCHLQSDNTIQSKMESIFERLNINDKNKNNEGVYMAIFEAMSDSFNIIIANIKNK